MRNRKETVLTFSVLPDVVLAIPLLEGFSFEKRANSETIILMLFNPINNTHRTFSTTNQHSHDVSQLLLSQRPQRQCQTIKTYHSKVSHQKSLVIQSSVI